MDPPPNNNNNNVDNDAAALGIAAAMAEDEDQEEEDVDADEAICQEAITLLQNRVKFHSRLRDRTMVIFARQFVNNVKEDIYQTITDTRTIDEGYDGLDSERDTEDEVATAIRCCPEVLARRDERFQYYPIQCLTFTQDENNTKMTRNMKAVSFIPLFVQVAMEFNSFLNEERGGLLIEDDGGGNVLHDLMNSSSDLSLDDHRHQHVDTTCLAVLIRLRRSGYFVKNDIQHYGLVHFLCQKKYFSEQRFQFLSEWDPASLLRTNVNNESPLHRKVGDSREFQVLLEAYFRYYPRWKGLRALFTLNNEGETPFELACEALPQPRVMEVVEEILVRYTTNTCLVNTTTTNNNGNAMLLAASEDTMSLDGLYFLIRRQPNTMLSMVRHRNHNSNNTATHQNSHDPGVDSTASDDNNGNSTNDHGSNNDHSSVAVLQRSTGKRKRN